MCTVCKKVSKKERETYRERERERKKERERERNGSPQFGVLVIASVCSCCVSVNE